jgi:hypothetical protein
MLRRVVLVRTHVSVELIVSFTRAKRVNELADSFHLDDGGDTLRQKSILNKNVRRPIPEDGIFQCWSCCRLLFEYLM